MAEITSDNIDWRIIEQVQSVLAGASSGDSTLFKSVELCASDSDTRGVRPTGTGPAAIIEFLGDSERETLEQMRCRVITLRIRLASRAAPVAESSLRLRKMLDLLALVRNAIESDPPSEACAWGDRYGWRDKLTWTKTSISDPGDGPWIKGSVDLAINYTQADAFSH